MSDNNIKTDITDIDVTDNEYLSDVELDMLISMVEEKDVVEAPEYILNDILEHVDSKQSDMHDTVSEEINSLPPSKPEKPPKIVNISKRRRQYYAYCVKVSIAIAASIGILVGWSLIENVNMNYSITTSSVKDMPEQIREGIPDKDSYLSTQYVSKEEVSMSYYDKIKNKAQKKIEKINETKNSN